MGAKRNLFVFSQKLHGIDIKSATDDRCTVLHVTVACEHRNYRLVDFLLDNYQELLNIETLKLETVVEETKDE